MFKPTYSIVRWGELYENNRTRELANLRWVPIPNSHDSDSYNELVDRKNGAALFGAWIAIVQLASRCKVRGTLTRDNGEPHDSRSIARITRLPVQTIEEALLVCNVECKWLEINAPQEGAGFPQASAGIPQDDAPRVCAGNGRKEENGREGTELNHATGKKLALVEFDRFWSLYPRKVAKKDALEAWLKAGCTFEDCEATITAWVKSTDWTKDGGQYIPHPATWLNAKRWQDGPPMTAPGQIPLNQVTVRDCDVIRHMDDEELPL